MSDLGPNLAARPFTNERPVKRTTLLVWVVALVLLATNVILYQRHLSSQYGQRQAIEDLQDQIRTEEAAIEKRETDLTAIELNRQNQKVVFLNAQIVRRAFSWSQLFDRLEEVLPANVELERVSPKILNTDPKKSRGKISSPDDLVAIEMRGQAKTDEELLQFVDNLFEHPSFTRPNLQGEDERDEGGVEFSLRVVYLPADSSRSQVEVGETTIEEVALPLDSSGGDR